MSNGTTAEPAGVQTFGEKMMRGDTPEPMKMATDVSKEAVEEMARMLDTEVRRLCGAESAEAQMLRAQSSRIAELEAQNESLKSERAGIISAKREQIGRLEAALDAPNCHGYKVGVAVGKASQQTYVDLLEIALVTAQSEARRYAEIYPQSSDGRNTFLLLADRIDGLALIPSNPTPEPTAAMFGLDGVDNDE